MFRSLRRGLCGVAAALPLGAGTRTAAHAADSSTVRTAAVQSATVRAAAAGAQRLRWRLQRRGEGDQHLDEADRPITRAGRPWMISPRPGITA